MRWYRVVWPSTRLDSAITEWPPPPRRGIGVHDDVHPRGPLAHVPEYEGLHVKAATRRRDDFLPLLIVRVEILPAQRRYGFRLCLCYCATLASGLSHDGIVGTV